MMESGASTPRPPAQGVSARMVIFAILILLLIGGVAGGWAMTRFAAPEPAVLGTAAPTPLPTPLAPASPNAAPSALVAAKPLPSTSSAPTELVTRVTELEAQLAALAGKADSPSGNAARAEGLLIAFAARRALDRGLPLGFLEGQLRLRFGDAQPNAVQTIVETARSPVTLHQLRSEFERLAPALAGRSASQSGLWLGFQRELNELFVLRDADAPRQQLTDRLDRARYLLDSGLVDRAVAEVERLPGAAGAATWLATARRYHAARRALDLIETAALLEPSAAPAAVPGPAPAPAPAPNLAPSV